MIRYSVCVWACSLNALKLNAIVQKLPVPETCMDSISIGVRDLWNKLSEETENIAKTSGNSFRVRISEGCV